MKNLFKVTSLCAAVLMGGNVYAASESASDVFQWSGTIPASAVNSGSLNIVNTGSIAFSDGSMTFTETSGGKYELKSASDMIFQIQNVSGGTVNISDLAYEVSSVKFSAGGGFMKEVSASPEFNVTIDGADVVKGAQQSLDAATDIDKDIRLSLASSALDTVAPGDEVAVQATLLITYENN